MNVVGMEDGVEYDNSSFNDFVTDKKIFIDPSYIKKYKKYDNYDIPIKFDFYLINDKIINRNNCKNGNIITDNKTAADLCSDGHYQVLFFGNWASNNYMPFTSWILFHRTFHTISMTRNKKYEKELSYIYTGIAGAVNDMYHFINLSQTYIDNPHETCEYQKMYKFMCKHNVYSLDNWKKIDGLLDINDFVFEFKQFSKYIYGFAAARKELNLIGLDHVCEVFAQFWINGKFKFIDVYTIPDSVIKKEFKQKLNDSYRYHEENINKALTALIPKLSNQWGML